MNFIVVEFIFEWHQINCTVCVWSFGRKFWKKKSMFLVWRLKGFQAEHTKINHTNIYRAIRRLHQSKSLRPPRAFLITVSFFPPLSSTHHLMQFEWHHNVIPHWRSNTIQTKYRTSTDTNPMWAWQTYLASAYPTHCK